MMAIRKAEAVWTGDLKEGSGQVKLGSGTLETAYSFKSRFEDGKGTNPEELIAAAHAGCFSMALTHGLSQAGHQPQQVQTVAKVHLEKSDGGFSIPNIELETQAKVPGIEDAEFQKHAEAAKTSCPVSKVLAGAKITLNASLSNG